MPYEGESAPAKLEGPLPEKESPKRRDIVSFGPFRLCPTERLLEKDGVPLNLGSRALDLLITLFERAPQLVSKQELMANVWRNLVVDEGSLRFHIRCGGLAVAIDPIGAPAISPGLGVAIDYEPCAAQTQARPP
jgi:Transcriptional regulatory protein, C terminal